MSISNKFKKIIILSIILFGVFFVNSVKADEPCVDGQNGCLYGWNQTGASGTTWPGWTWFNDADGYGASGWRRNDFDNYWFMPRSHAKEDYGNSVLAQIVTNDRAPSTSSGGALKVYNTGGTSKVSAWWWLHLNNFGQYGWADSTTNRFSFYFKPVGIASPGLTTSDPEGDNFQFGQYLCWSGGGLGGEDCPKEANGQHYYHHLTVNPGAWLKVQLDRHPQHQRGVSGSPVDNPAAPKNYFQYMNTWYLENSYQINPSSYYLIDEIKLSTASQPENDISIASVWVGYWPSTDKWEIGFMDSSWGTNYNDNSIGTYEIRYSTSPITNANFASASLITPEYNAYGSGRIRRPNQWKEVAWTRFALPNSIETSVAKVYFAIKDVSSTANGDGHNAPNSNTHTIDYNIRPNSGSGDTTPPAAPTGLTVN